MNNINWKTFKDLGDEVQTKASKVRWFHFTKTYIVTRSENEFTTIVTTLFQRVWAFFDHSYYAKRLGEKEPIKILSIKEITEIRQRQNNKIENVRSDILENSLQIPLKDQPSKIIEEPKKERHILIQDKLPTENINPFPEQTKDQPPKIIEEPKKEPFIPIQDKLPTNINSSPEQIKDHPPKIIEEPKKERHILIQDKLPTKNINPFPEETKDHSPKIIEEPKKEPLIPIKSSDPLEGEAVCKEVIFFLEEKIKHLKKSFFKDTSELNTLQEFLDYYKKTKTIRLDGYKWIHWASTFRYDKDEEKIQSMFLAAKLFEIYQKSSNQLQKTTAFNLWKKIIGWENFTAELNTYFDIRIKELEKIKDKAFPLTKIHLAQLRQILLTDDTNINEKLWKLDDWLRIESEGVVSQIRSNRAFAEFNNFCNGKKNQIRGLGSENNPNYVELDIRTNLAWAKELPL